MITRGRHIGLCVPCNPCSAAWKEAQWEVARPEGSPPARGAAARSYSPRHEISSSLGFGSNGDACGRVATIAGSRGNSGRCVHALNKGGQADQLRQVAQLFEMLSEVQEKEAPLPIKLPRAGRPADEAALR